jgi:uncharacterized protein
MHRSIMHNMEEWKNSPLRKPLILQGARQVGKTWIMKEFGSKFFQKTAYINFESSIRLQNIFQEDFSIARLISIFEIESGQKIEPSNTLIILDEIQEAERGLTALKYFYENASEYYVIAAGSLLGISIQKDSAFPVGKVDFLTLYPMSFEEFLINSDEKPLAEALHNGEWDVLLPFHERLTHYLRTYYFVGGMPEVVQAYINTRDFALVRIIQNNIITGYENDFAKYAQPEIVPRIRMVWQSVLGQLAKENKKFTYGQLKKGARAQTFESAIHWLVNAGLILKSYRVAKPAIPLKSYFDFDVFKLYLLDIGLLNAMGDISEQILLNKNQILTEYKGALTEQFVAQELTLQHDLYYWSADNGSAELDFLLQKGQNIIPVEVKAEENLKAKSLFVFEGKYKTGKATRLSMSRYRQNRWMVNIPLYAALHL